MRLTELQIKNAKASTGPTKLFDGGGMFLEVTPTGSKRWRLKYRFSRKEQLLSLGCYPEVSLKEARNRRDEARRQISQGINPSDLRKAHKSICSTPASDSFEFVAREWIAKKASIWSESNAKLVVARLENYVFPWIGKRSIAEISPPDLLSVLRPLEAKGVNETAHRVHGYCSQVFRYAVATGRIPSDPSRDLRGALAPVKETHFAAVTEPKKVGALLRMLDGYDASPVVSTAIKIAPLVFVRPGELRQAEWKDIDLKKAEWRFTTAKTNTQHIVPLATQAVSLLEALHPITGRGRYVFPSPRTINSRFERPMSNVAILAALRRMEIPKTEMCGHGFRAMARTLLDEALRFPPHLIEHQLAHSVKDPLGRAYNRTTHLTERKEMMQRWADYLDQLKTEKQEGES